MKEFFEAIGKTRVYAGLVILFIAYDFYISSAYPTSYLKMLALAIGTFAYSSLLMLLYQQARGNLSKTIRIISLIVIIGNFFYALLYLIGFVYLALN